MQRCIRVLVTAAIVSAAAPTPIGTLMKKIDCQPKESVSAPPKSGPIATAAPIGDAVQPDDTGEPDPHTAAGKIAGLERRRIRSRSRRSRWHVSVGGRARTCPTHSTLASTLAC